MSYATSGGTKRYADYTNSNSGQTQFADTWQKGAQYQQLRGASNGTVNDAFNQHFANSKGGDKTGTVADDGGGWRLIKQDGGKTSNERLEDYRKIAEQWQAAGYDVRVQDHNPEFGKSRTSEIAVRMGAAPEQTPEPTPEPLPPRGSTFTEDTQKFKDTRLQNPGNQVPRMGYTDDPYRDAISHGEDLNAHYTNKFIPSLEAEARLTAQEIGESGRFNLNRFVGKIPELGDIKELTDHYIGEVKKAA